MNYTVPGNYLERCRWMTQHQFSCTMFDHETPNNLQPSFFDEYDLRIHYLSKCKNNIFHACENDLKVEIKREWATK